ncbi:MAG: hypothetical protein QXN05_02860 [Acidilobaceae archaeon]
MAEARVEKARSTDKVIARSLQTPDITKNARTGRNAVTEESSARGVLNVRRETRAKTVEAMIRRAS